MRETNPNSRLHQTTPGWLKYSSKWFPTSNLILPLAFHPLQVLSFFLLKYSNKSEELLENEG